MEDELSCGHGLAENAVLPRKMAEVVGALAETLERHTTALDRADENARTEEAAYRSLAHQYRAIEGRLRNAAVQMEGYRDLPAALHDSDALTSRENASAFERLIAAEAELADVVEERLDEHRALAAGGRR